MRHKKLVINLLEHGILHGRKQNTSYRVCFCLLGRENVNIRLFLQDCLGVTVSLVLRIVLKLS